ncbi:MAG: SAM-dependent methyltransferase [Clostridiales bacterium]|nr:SAM-dependent methyltransferase [Clostridiales bacterium]
MTVLECKNPSEILKITASNPTKDCEFLRVSLRPVTVKNILCFQAEKFKGTQVFHENISFDSLSDWLEENVVSRFKQLCVVLRDKDVTYLFSNGKVKRLEKTTKPKNFSATQSNNRNKKYILNEGDDIPVFVDLGIFTKEGKIVKSMFDKFRQINRFVEILDDVLKQFDGDEITVLDFGCGKSYLTFVIYHYLVNIKNINAKIIGYDLKSDVVSHCNELATKYRYDNLQFVVADVSKDKLYDEKIDVVVSLHACDTATDYALHYAVSHNVPYIFSVPCCQHEVNNTISKANGDIDVLLKYGIVKERVAALLTDTVRAMLLEDEGYSVDVMEFVDLAHSPKNLMIRARLAKPKTSKNKQVVENLMERYRFEQTLYKLLHTGL